MAYIKPTASYKMSKALKTSLSLSRYTSDPHLLGAIRRSGVQAELAAQVKHKAEKRGSEAK